MLFESGACKLKGNTIRNSNCDFERNAPLSNNHRSKFIALTALHRYYDTQPFTRNVQ